MDVPFDWRILQAIWSAVSHLRQFSDDLADQGCHFTHRKMTFQNLSPSLAFLAGALPILTAQNASGQVQPLATPDLVFEEVIGIVAVEAEHFYKQSLTDKRAWHITTSKSAPDVQPDGDPTHVGGASGGAYVECLPDTRRTHGDKLIHGENFSNEPGKMAVLHYKVHFNTPGRYYVWVRAFSTGSEDNGLHVGLDGAWPESGQRLQWCEGKHTWRWDSRQRTEKNHCGEPYKIYLDIEKAGEHEIAFSMREDGFEFDQFILTTTREFVPPQDGGPVSKVKQGKLPEAFPLVAAAPAPAAEAKGKAKAKETTTSAPRAVALALNAADFSVAGTGYYLDRGQWLAINPDKNKSAKAQSAFPFPNGKYHVTLHTVGENDGRSTFQVAVNDVKVGEFTAPLSREMFEEGAKFASTWKSVTLNSGDVITVSSQVASEDGQEFSRARIARLAFEPADDATKAATAKLAQAGGAAAPKRPTGPPLVLPRKPDGSGEVAISGELKQWHKVTLTLDGPFAHERDNEPNPFTDYRFFVDFRHESGSPRYVVPGYFAVDGDAANTSAEAGTKWRAHLAPDKAGKWNYKVWFLRGKLAAVSDEPISESWSPGHGRTGEFTVAPTDKTGRDFRAKGRLQYVGKHHLQFAGTKEFFLKAGPDAPETLLAYVDFDGTTVAPKKNAPLKTWQAHVKDWQAGDPAWKDGKGKGLIGALNYLATKGVNAFSFLPYNAGGDGDNIWPFVERDDKLHYDCSKLDQWGVVFDHATAKGLYLHFKLQENEMDDDRRGHGDGVVGSVPESLDGGRLGIERRLYCRELIARYAHNLALNWNIGEENTQSTGEIVDMVRYLHGTDPYQHNIVIHTFPNQQEKVYTPLLGNKSLLTGASLQNSWSQVHQRTLQWLNESAKAGRPWVVANDEQGPASLGVPPDPGYQGHDGIARVANKPDAKGKAPSEGETRGYTLHDIRKLTLWGNLMAGGAGVEYYFGYQLPENDLVCEDWRSRDKTWDYCRIALEFFHAHKVPFWEMQNANALIGNTKNDNSKFCFARAGELYLVYLPTGGTTDLDLGGANGAFSVKWFNPRTGGALSDGPVKSVTGGGKVSLGHPPADANEDWLVVVRKS
jgi:hypothetical protein